MKATRTVGHWTPVLHRLPAHGHADGKIEFHGFSKGFAQMSTTLALGQRVLFKPQRKEEKIAVCSGSMPLSPEDRVEILSILATDADPDISERAQNALLTQPVAYFVKALERADSDVALFRYATENLAAKPGIADALAKNVGCPAKLVTRVVPHLTSSGIQGLLDNLEQFCEDAALVEAVLRSTAPNAEQRALLDELTKGTLSRSEVEEAAGDLEPDIAQRETLMQRLANMSVVQRLMMALKGGKSERMALIRDPNKLVQRSVLQSPRLTDSEVEAFASMSNLTGEVLRGLSNIRAFMKNYTVMKNLVNNPKTPLDVTLHLYQRLTPGDLVKLSTNKNVPETLRSSAAKLHRKRKTGQE
jgi:hypothetical protein